MPKQKNPGNNTLMKKAARYATSALYPIARKKYSASISNIQSGI